MRPCSSTCRHLVSVLGMGSYQHSSWEDVCNSLFLVEEYAGEAK